MAVGVVLGLGKPPAPLPFPGLVFERVLADPALEGIVQRPDGNRAVELLYGVAHQRPNTSAVTLARVAMALETNIEYLLGLTDDTQSIGELVGDNG